MNDTVKQYAVEKTKELTEAFSCSAEAKAAAEAWLKALGTRREAAETENYLAELEEDIMPIDQLIGFADSPAGQKYFGEDRAKKVAAHGREVKAAGGQYCDCPACLAAQAILEKKKELLG